MEGRGRSRARKKRFFSPKRLTSFLLAAAMVFTNVGADLSTAFAADSTDVSFEMRGADLVAAIEDAVASENVVAPDDLNFTNGNVEKFEDFLFGDGKLYEAYPEMDGGDVETELRVFVRLPESADDMYAVTGDEEVIFLYVNNSDETVRFRSYISYTKDGEEEIKRTDSVTVRSYESAYGDEEVNVISDPVEVPETEESTEAPETAAPETEVPAEEPETEIPADETVTAPEEETPAEETAGEEDPVATESEMKVSFSRNEAALVAAPAGDDPKATPSEMEDSKDPEESNEGLVDEGNMPNEKDPADVPGESAPAEESTPADETTVTGEPQVPETTAPETTPAATPSETVPEKKPDAPKPSYSDLVGIGWSGTAKMYVSTLNQLHAFDDINVEEGTYELTIAHVLQDEAGTWAKEETITLAAEDFVNGAYDTAQNEYVKDGMELSEKAPVVKAEAFEGEDGVYTYYAELSYEVMDGWHIVKEEKSNPGISLFAVYVGDLDEVVIEPDKDHVVVTIQFVDDTGIFMDDPMVISVEDTNEEGQYVLSQELDIPEGYSAAAEGAQIENGVLHATFDKNKEEATIVVTYTPNTVNYTVKYYYQNIEDDNYTEEETSTKSGRVGELTNVEPETVDGFTAQDVEQQVIAADGTTVVAVKYDRNVYTLLFNTNGGSYVPSVQAKYGETVYLDANPTKTGYRFIGWYADEDLKHEVKTVQLTADSTMVYAKWVGALVDYRMVYLTENANDDGYSYVGTVTDRAQAGTTIQANANSRKPMGFDTQHFTFESSDQAEVKADGSTVITVKYSRNEYTITFQGTGDKTLVCEKEEHVHEYWKCGIWIPLLGWTDCDQEEHTHSIGNGCYKIGEDRSITAKYEANIGEKWLEAVGPRTPWEGVNWLWDPEANYRTGFQEIMPGENKILTNEGFGKVTQKLYYYVEDASGDEEFIGKTFKELYSVTLKVTSNTNATFDEEFFPIDGYERYGSNISAWWNGKENNRPSVPFPKGNVAKFYYVPEEYDLLLVDGDSKEEHSIAYGSDISQYTSKQGLPSEVDRGTFAGWYIDPEFETPYEGDAKMPKGLVLYAKRQGEIYQVTFEPNNGEAPTVISVESGKTVDSMPEYPTRQDYIFDGWYTNKNGEEVVFDPMTQITGDTNVYAKWIQSQTISYTVYHQTEAGKDIVAPEQKYGKANASVQARALSGDSLPEDYKGYVPNKISDTIVLTPGGENKIVFTYTKMDTFSYKVIYTYKGETIQTKDVKDVKENILTVYAELNEDTLKAGYDVDGSTAQRVTLVADAGANVVEFPLKLAEYTITYNLNGGSNAQANPSKYRPAELSDNPIQLQQPTKNGYAFDGWELTQGEVISGVHNEMAPTIEAGSYGNLTFEATWKQAKVKYTVNYFYDGTRSVSESKTEEGMLGEKIPFMASSEKYYQNTHYTLEKIDKLSEGIITDDPKSNIVNIYYVKDELGGTEEEPGDGVPDKYQAVVKYESAGNGSVEGTTVELLTFKYIVRNLDGTIGKVIDAPASPKAMVDVVPDQGYRFVKWTSGDQTYADVTEIQKVNITKNTTFTAHFEKALPDMYELLVEHVYMNKDGATKDYVFQEYSDRVPAGNEIVIRERPMDGYTVDGYTFGRESDEFDGRLIDGKLAFEMPAEKTYVRVFYFEDRNGDAIPDMYQVEVTYTTDGHGYVNDSHDPTATEYVTLYIAGMEEMGYAKPGDLGAKGYTKAEGISATAEANYDFVNWTYGTDGMTEKVTPAGIEVTAPMEIKANFAPQEREWQVLYFNEDNAEIRAPQTGTVRYGDRYDLTEYIYEDLMGSDGHHYVKIGTDGSDISGIAQEEEEKVIWVKVIYALDDLGGTDPENPGDKIPDKYQTIITFKAIHGHFDGETEVNRVVTLYDAKGEMSEDGKYAISGETDVPEPQPDEGYTGGIWDPSPFRAIVSKNSNREFIVTFQPQDYMASIYYYFDGELAEEWTKQEKYPYGDVLDINEAESVEYQGKQYALDTYVGNPLTIGKDESENVIHVYYGLDENGDKIPDLYQDTIVFAAVNGTFSENETTQVERVITYTNDGTKTGEWDKNGKYTLTDEDIPAATAAAGYTQDSLKWDDPAPQNYTIFRYGDEFGHKSVKTFIVRFTGEADQTYTVQHVDEATGETLHPEEVKSAKFGTYVWGKNEAVDIPGYAFVRADDLVVSANNDENKIVVYYGKDSIGPDGDNDPDGEPDAYQIVFTFKSSDEAKGTLSGTTRQVYTFKDNDGNYVKPAEGISQRAVQQYLEGTMEGFEAVTITSKEGYEFDYWTVENQEVAPDYTSTMDELGNTPFTQNTTFVVYFSSVGGSSENPGGDSGNGGNSGGGGGGSSSGPSGSGGSSTAGPGVTITDGDVPLAPLPSDGSGSSAVIFDDNVPLAPLPKTGQESLKAPLTALFAGIFLALASLKRRKEEN